MLDSIHKLSGQEKSRDPLDRMIDLMNNRSPLSLHQSNKILPIIRIPLLYKPAEEVSLKTQKEKAEFIASNIKLI